MTEEVTQNVTLQCSHSPAPGVYWDVTVSFVGNENTYQVWSQADEEPTEVLLKEAAGPLTWRRMVADIRELSEIGLGGDLLSDIQVDGVTEWEASLLKMAWCKYDGPADGQLELLLGLPDETISLLAEVLGDLADPDALAALNDVIEGDTSIEALLQRAGGEH